MAVIYDYILDDLRLGEWKDATQFFSANKFIRPVDSNRAMYVGDATTVPLIFSGEIAIFESDNTGGTYYPVVNHGSGVGSISVMVSTHGTSDAPTYKDSNQVLGGYAFGGMNDSSTGYGLAGFATGVWGIVDNTVSGSTIPMSLQLGAFPLFGTSGIKITSTNDILFYTQGGGSGAVVARTDYSDNRFYFGTGDESWFNNVGSLKLGGSLSLKNTETTGDYTATTEDNVIKCNASTANITVTLPTVSDGLTYNIKKIDSSANIVTILASGGALIEGVASIDIETEGDCYTILSDGTNWYII